MLDLSQHVKGARNCFALDWYKSDKEIFTEMGKLVHDIKYKYRDDASRTEEYKTIVRKIATELERFTDDIEVIVPMPSYNPRSRANPRGEQKIIYSITAELAKNVEKKYVPNVLIKINDKQSKVENLSRSDFRVNKDIAKELDKVLLIDDLFGTGKTANICIELLKESNPGMDIDFVSLTQNKYGGIAKLTECKIKQSSKITLTQNGKSRKINMYFTDNGDDKEVYLFSDNEVFEKVSEAIKKAQYDQKFCFPIKQINGYWKIISQGEK